MNFVVFQMSSKAKVTIAAGAVVCNECELKGEVTWTGQYKCCINNFQCVVNTATSDVWQVTIGPRTVVHPKARILAEAGPIFIGEGNLIGLTINLSLLSRILLKWRRGAVRDNQQGRGRILWSFQWNCARHDNWQQQCLWSKAIFTEQPHWQTNAHSGGEPHWEPEDRRL